MKKKYYLSLIPDLKMDLKNYIEIKFFKFNQLVKLANDFPEIKFIWFPFKKEGNLPEIL